MQPTLRGAVEWVNDRRSAEPAYLRCDGCERIFYDYEPEQLWDDAHKAMYWQCNCGYRNFDKLQVLAGVTVSVLRRGLIALHNMRFPDRPLNVSEQMNLGPRDILREVWSELAADTLDRLHRTCYNNYWDYARTCDCINCDRTRNDLLISEGIASDRIVSF